MGKGRTFFTQIGITKKDLNEMSGCLSLMFLLPISLVIETFKAVYLIITNIFNFILKNNNVGKCQNDKDYKYEIIEYKKNGKNGYYAHVRIFDNEGNYYDHKKEAFCSYETPSKMTENLKTDLYNDALWHYNFKKFANKDTNK